MIIQVYGDDDSYEEHDFPSKYSVCPECEGRGTRMNRNIDAKGITCEEFANDPEFAENYWNGVYDVPCYDCKGLRVVECIDEGKLDLEQKEVFARYYEQKCMREDFRREWANEIRTQDGMMGDS
jgi:hypothetical protein